MQTGDLFRAVSLLVLAVWGGIGPWAGSLAFAADETEVKPQYKFEQIVIARPSDAEKKLPAVDLDKAVTFLEQASQAWNGERKCVACHTNGIYMTIRPALEPFLGPSDTKQRDFFVEVLNKKKSGPRSQQITSTNPAQIVYTAAGLAEWDARKGGKPSAETDAALRLMFSIQKENGTWHSLDCWPPYESDAYHLATVAAMAAATAPGWLDTEAVKKDEELQRTIGLLKDYLQKTEPLHDYSRVLLLWTATRWKGLVTPAQQESLVALLKKQQRDDGGWSIRTFASPEKWGGGNRAAKIKSEPDFANPASDGHMTGLAVIVLRASGVDKTAPEIQKAITWIKSNQRESGRWWTRSLNTDTYHFITYSGTAFPLMALAECGELPKRVPAAAASGGE